MKGGVPWPI